MRRLVVCLLVIEVGLSNLRAKLWALLRLLNFFKNIEDSCEFGHLSSRCPLRHALFPNKRCRSYSKLNQLRSVNRTLLHFVYIKIEILFHKGVSLSKKQKYVISEADVQYFAKDLLGIDGFGYKESDEYNEKDATYECTEYPSYGFVNRTYENKRIEKLSDSIWKFSVDVKENKENSQEFITEIYTVQDAANGYRMLSVKRIDSEGKEVTSDLK